jgi:hypothetical protein
VLTADEAPQHVSFAGALAYVTSGDSGSIQRRAAHAGTLVRSTAIPRGSYNLQTAGDRVLTPSLMHGTLTVLDLGGRVLASPRVAAAAHDACVI